MHGFSQTEDPVVLLEDTDFVSEGHDTIGYEGDHVMLKTEIIFINKIKNNDTLYIDQKDVEDFEMNMTVIETGEIFYYSPKYKFTYFEFDYDKIYKIVYSAKGFYAKTIYLDTHDSEIYKYGYLFPCEVRLYKMRGSSKKYRQTTIPYIKYDPTTKFFEFTLRDMGSKK